MKSIPLSVFLIITSFLPPVRADRPSYAGANGAFAAPSSIKLMDDISAARFVWESEEKRIGYGKTTTSGIASEFEDLPPAGGASPLAADGLVILAYFSPSCAIMHNIFREGDRNRDPSGQRYKVAADDVVLAMDAGTGKTRWKFVAADKGMSLPMGKREGWGITPAAANGRVFAIGTTGRVYALDLKSGKLHWEAMVPRYAVLEQMKKRALEKQRVVTASADSFRSIYGLLLVVADTLIAPDLAGGLIGFDCATGKQLWASAVPDGLTTAWNMPARVRLGQQDLVVTVNGAGKLRLIDIEDGKVVWTHDLSLAHLTHLHGRSQGLSTIGKPLAHQKLNVCACGYRGI